MTPGRKDDREIDLPALVCQLQQLAEQIRRQVDRELDSQNKLPQVPCGPSGPQTQPKSDRLEKHQEVYALAEQGLEPLEIAQRTDRTLGEIQVILALRKSE
ncbi:MAG: hypothetical protein KAT11_05770 [Phycisphaerae bacterium]|nr:hypothetical protein [Phycisphaerae bacterium]